MPGAYNGLREESSILRHALRNRFDLVVFDAAPTVSLLNLNAILACDDLIIPVLADALSLHSLKTVMKTLASIEADFGHRIRNTAVVLNRFAPDDARCRINYRYGKLANVIFGNAMPCQLASAVVADGTSFLPFPHRPACNGGSQGGQTADVHNPSHSRIPGEARAVQVLASFRVDPHVLLKGQSLGDAGTVYDAVHTLHRAFQRRQGGNVPQHEFRRELPDEFQPAGLANQTPDPEAVSREGGDHVPPPRIRMRP